MGRCWLLYSSCHVGFVASSRSYLQQLVRAGWTVGSLVGKTSMLLALLVPSAISCH